MGRSRDERVQKIIRKYDQMENRMNTLAAEKVKTNENDAPRVQPQAGGPGLG